MPPRRPTSRWTSGRDSGHEPWGEQNPPGWTAGGLRSTVELRSGGPVPEGPGVLQPALDTAQRLRCARIDASRRHRLGKVPEYTADRAASGGESRSPGLQCDEGNPLHDAVHSNVSHLLLWRPAILNPAR